MKGLTSTSGVAALAPMPGRHRLAAIGFGHGLYGAFNWVIDNVVYVYVVHTLGMVVGGAIMTTFSLVQCAVTLIVYERMGIDWVGAGFVQALRDKPHPNAIERLVIWASHGHPVIIFLLLCAWQDPFITTAYFRGGRFHGLSSRDWQLFLLAVLVSNLYWIFVADLIGEVVAALWTFITR